MAIETAKATMKAAVSGLCGSCCWYERPGRLAAICRHNRKWTIDQYQVCSHYKYREEGKGND